MEPLYFLAFSQIGNLTGYKHISTGHEAEGLWALREVVVLPPRVSREPWLPCPLGNCLQVGFAIVLCYKSYTHPQSFLWTWCLSYDLSLCLFLSHTLQVMCVFPNQIQLLSTWTFPCFYNSRDFSFSPQNTFICFHRDTSSMSSIMIMRFS